MKNICLFIVAFCTILFQSLKAQEKRQVWELAPILNYVFFDLGKSEIPTRYKLFKNPNETKSFNEDSLKGSPLEKYYDVLNVMASRLVKLPTLKISITGCNDGTTDEEKSAGLSKARAQSVYSYFRDIWGISEDRMQLIIRERPALVSNLKDTNGIKENRRVEITVQNEDEKWNLIRPILDKKSRFTSHPLCLDLQNNTMTNIKISDNSKWTYEVYSIILIPFDTVEFPPFILSVFENYVYPRIHNKTIIQIVGHTDAVGLAEHNMRLSQQRALSYERIFKSYSKGKLGYISACGLGEESPIYSNETPEGRFYNRTVQIIIQNPIESK